MEYFVDDYWDELYNEDNIGKVGGEKVGKYSDDEIRNCKKITLQIAASYLGISPMAVGLGMRNDLPPIGFAIKHENRYSESWGAIHISSS